MRKILIATPHLNSGGVEVSMLRFLNELIKNKENKVELLLLKKEGLYVNNIPEDIPVNIVSYDDDIYNYNYEIKDVRNIDGIMRKIKFFFYRLKLKMALNKNAWSRYYDIILKHVVPIRNEYDLVIDWHGYGHFLTSVVACKTVSKKKVMWIHDEKNEWIDKVIPWMEKFDKIFCVGVACKNNVLKNYPNLKQKVDVFYNMTDYKNVREKSLEKIDINYDENKINLVTIGRLEWQKGYDVAIMIAKKLKDKGFNFCWYAIGGGHQKTEIENMIEDNNLGDCFKLLGIKKNPYPYVKKADYFVLSSRHEGYCLATLEAKILGKIIIATDIESNREQIKNGINGFLCELNPEIFANTIIKVSKDEKTRKKIVKNLEKENFDYTSEFKKLYKLLEE